MPVTRETPFQVLLLGDFSGRAHRGVCETGDQLAARTLFQLSPDNIDSVIAELGVELPNLTLAPGKTTTLRIQKFDDLHPDELYRNLDIFEHLQILRSQLQDSQTFSKAAAEVQGWRIDGDDASAESNSNVDGTTDARLETADSERGPDLPADNLLDAVLEASEEVQPHPPKSDLWKSLVAEVASQYAVPEDDPKLPILLARVDGVIEGLIRAILQHESFRQLDSAWHAIKFLLRRLEIGADLKLYLGDISKDELLQDLCASDDLAASGFYRFILEHCAAELDHEPISAIVGDYTFHTTDEDATLLGRLAKVTAAAKSTWVAAASEASCSDSWMPDQSEQIPASSAANGLWQTLRQLPESACVALARPNFLARLPYGSETHPIDSFDFDEIAASVDTTTGLSWGNSAFLVALALGQAFAKSGWEINTTARFTIEGLPLYMRHSANEPEGELVCTKFELDGSKIRDQQKQGFVPVIWERESDRVHLPGILSLYGTPLLGVWDC